MYRVQLIGAAGAAYDNLAACWRHRMASFEHCTIDALPEVIERIRAQRPEWIVYCGYASESSWEGNSTRFDNPTQVAQLAHSAAEVGARLAVISSDRVFAGPGMFHEEGEPVSEDERAQRWHTMEQAALAIDSAVHRALVVRTNCFGWSVAGESFAEQVWRSLERCEPIELDASSYATPILASDLPELLLRCFRARLQGIVHLGGAERTSPLRFAHELARAASFDGRLVRAKDTAPADSEAPLVACETSLGSRLVRRELDIGLPLLRESLARFVEQATSGYRDAIRGEAQVTVARAA